MKNEYIYIGKCGAKGCKTIHRVSVPAKVWTERVNVNYCPGSNNPPIYEARIKQAPSYHPSQVYPLFCITHRRDVCFKEIDGRVSADHVCDSRCTGATGPNCDCSCGGLNHGAAYSVKLNCN